MLTQSETTLIAKLLEDYGNTDSWFTLRGGLATLDDTPENLAIVEAAVKQAGVENVQNSQWCHHDDGQLVVLSALISGYLRKRLLDELTFVGAVQCQY